MREENLVLSNIVKDVFPDTKQYEGDVPQNFTRPCFLFINPAKTDRTTVVSAFMYKAQNTYTVYYFSPKEEQAKQMGIDRLDHMTDVLQKVRHHAASGTKWPIPNSDRRFLTIEQISADAHEDADYIEFTFVVSRFIKRERTPAPVIREVQITIDVRDSESLSETQTTISQQGG